MNKRDTAIPGTTSQKPRWEGPPENRPAGYLPAEDDPTTERDAAGETLKDPDRRTIADGAKTRDVINSEKKQR